MAVTLPKLETKNPISVSLAISIFFLFLVTKVKSDFSFSFRNFLPDVSNKAIGFANDATLKNGVIQLTKKDEAGNPLQHSVGQSGLIKPIRIYDKSSGKVANFVTEFTFLVNTNGRRVHGDGFAFFIVSPDFKIPDKTKSEGGFLGMFTPDTAFNSIAQQQVLLVEFDSFANEWDPNPVTRFSHLGIDVNSIKSVAVAPWFSDVELDGMVAMARIEYNSGAKKLSVSVTYSEKNQVNGDSSLSHDIDLTTILPEMVQIGFSASTGDLVETHDILSWSFTSNL